MIQNWEKTPDNHFKTQTLYEWINIWWNFDKGFILEIWERVVLKKIMNEKMYKTVAATKYTIELYKFDKLGFLKLWTFQQVDNENWLNKILNKIKLSDNYRKSLML